MKFLSSLLMALGGCAAWGGVSLGATTMPLVFNFQGKEIAMVRLPGPGLLIDSLCAKRPDSCQALQRLPRASLLRVQNTLFGGKNPGAAICQDIGGESVLGTDPNGNENSFCRFDDGSMIASSSLHAHGRDNDGI